VRLAACAPALPAFRKAYPEIGIDLALTEDTELGPGRGIDLSVRLGAPADKSVVTHQLTSADRQFCASPSYLARAGTPSVPNDVSKHDCLTYRRTAEAATWIFRKGRTKGHLGQQKRKSVYLYSPLRMSRDRW
jgi:DNA-binding transcriptional LysR family regulator